MDLRESLHDERIGLGAGVDVTAVDVGQRNSSPTGWDLHDTTWYKGTFLSFF